MYGYTHEWMDGLISTLMNERMNGLYTHGWMKVWMDGLIHSWMNEWLNEIIMHWEKFPKIKNGKDLVQTQALPDQEQGFNSASLL